MAAVYFYSASLWIVSSSEVGQWTIYRRKVLEKINYFKFPLGGILSQSGKYYYYKNEQQTVELGASTRWCYWLIGWIIVALVRERFLANKTGGKWWKTLNGWYTKDPDSYPSDEAIHTMLYCHIYPLISNVLLRTNLTAMFDRDDDITIKPATSLENCSTDR